MSARSEDRDRSRRDRGARGAGAGGGGRAARRRGLRSSSSAATAPSATLVPAAGYPLRAPRGLRASTAATRCAPRARSAQAGRRARRARARCCARGASTRCSAAAATSPGRSRSPRSTRAHPDRPDRGRQPPRPDQPRCSPRSPARVCLAFPIEGRDGAPLPRHRAGRCRRRRPSATPRAPPSASSPWRPCVLVFGGSLGLAHDQRGGARRPRRRRASGCCT